jgi:bacillithiol system protein YtxJ
MVRRELSLPDDPGEALAVIREASRTGPVLLFKRSPICGVSALVSGELAHWLEVHDSAEPPITIAEVDVIERRALARGLTAELKIVHQSPQALLFVGGELVWHGSHSDVTAGRLDELISR